jgi:recombination protein RecT
MTKAESDRLTPAQKVEQLFIKASQKIDLVVPAHMSAERIWRLALAAINRDPKLAEATPQSILLSTMQCAALGLEPSTALQQAYLVPFTNTKKWKEGNVWKELKVKEAQLIIGYRGFIMLAEQAGAATSIKAAVVRKRDQYRPVLEGGEFIHEPYAGEGDPGPMIAVYSRWVSSGAKRDYYPMTRWEIEKHRDRFAKKEYGKPDKLLRNQPWVTDFEGMAMKTPVRLASKFWPMQSERAERLRTAIAIDERSEGGASTLKEGLSDDVQSALHDVPEMRDYIEEPDYFVPPDDEVIEHEGRQEEPFSLPETREGLIKLAVDLANERRVSTPRLPSDMSDDELRTFITSAR